MSGVDWSSIIGDSSEAPSEQDIDLGKALSLDNLRERVLELSKDFDQSPFEGGAQRTNDVLQQLSQNASEGKPLSSDETQFLLSRLPAQVAPHATRLYKEQLASEGSPIDYEV